MRNIYFKYPPAPSYCLDSKSVHSSGDKRTCRCGAAALDSGS